MLSTQHGTAYQRKVSMKMNKVALMVLPLLLSATAALAQAPQSSIRESTDPARIAEIERRAQELRGAQPPMGSEAQPGMRPSMGAAHGEGHHAHGQMKGHAEGKRHHGKRHGHHRMHNAHPKGAPGPAR
ncbi:MAG: hypothetical protein ABWY05_14485 [Noviherbaspirillum sp.]